LDCKGKSLLGLTNRFAAVDGRAFLEDPPADTDIVPYYTLEDQLFVEPQPLAIPAEYELTRPIRMSRPEVAVARSHINIWRQIATGAQDYALILEDDVWFNTGFAKKMSELWDEIVRSANGKETFDVLYLSFLEVKYGAPKSFISDKFFRPERGLWHLSGYVLSRFGARRLLNQLPCRGPVDLWINQHFRTLNVFAARSSLINQRRDATSTNLYSVLPALTSIGALSCEGASLFNLRPTEQPVFAFCDQESGATSLAMALSMLGYRCCSDLTDLPSSEKEDLLAGKMSRIFNAYVNIGSLEERVMHLRDRFPNAKFIITARGDSSEMVKAFTSQLKDSDVAVLDVTSGNKWRLICEHLRCPPPMCDFPVLQDLGQRPAIDGFDVSEQLPTLRQPKWDESPWVVEQSRTKWHGVCVSPTEINANKNETVDLRIGRNSMCLDENQWLLRSDTFADNLALFRPENVGYVTGVGASLTVKRESLGVREYSAAAISSKNTYLFGRFETSIRASRAPGIVTGFFLHRNSPRQEIDIEIAGNRPDRLIVNVFYNPGVPGTDFNYGYRGSPSYIDLGFDASIATHKFAIEWTPTEIRWLVDNRLVHRRTAWNPTPIPHLPLTLHINSWITRSSELAGRISNKSLPSTTVVESISLNANSIDSMTV
jgi:GR25 family glycosyltransferase involved in LPS biosynthesis